MECYEDIIIHCAELLAQAHTVESEENKEAVRMIGRELQFGGLEMKRLDFTGKALIQSVCFMESVNVDRSRAKEYCYEEENGVTAVYTVYPTMGQGEWDKQMQKRLNFFVMQLHEANERQNLVQDANYYRYHDPQTKHTNMAYFSERCDQYIKNGEIDRYTAMAVNLSDFTNLNLLIGSSNCDIVLIKYMDWLKMGLEPDEIVSRISGDQFALLLHKDHEEMILDKLHASDIRYGNQENAVVTVSAEAGIYRLTEEVESYHNIIQAISSALNVAKNSVQLQFSYYDPLSADATEKKKFYEEAFEKALLNEDIHVFFQPKVSLKDYELIGAEALSRWVVDGEIVPPDSFIPILEETTRICELDFYVLNHVCKSIQSWIQHGVKPVKVSVNFSRRHLSNKNLVNDIVRVLDKYEVPHQYIEVELTETTIDADFAALKQIVYGLRECGIESSVDDFGMGYSSLSLIRDVPFKVLKIDKSFLGEKDMESDERQRAMMKHVISMANDLGMECIAEGVESMEHVQLLKESKCYMAQGFLFNRPIPQEEFEEILTKG
ncbi:MAG: putative bifunctional diguanylate cyclase/phosphodiesterase [Lachnospiraceae bacterium]